LDAAYKIYSELAEVAKKAARPLVGMAVVLKEQKQYKEALELLDKAQDNNENFVHLYVERGHIYSLQGEIEKAVEEYKSAIEISPLNPVRYQDAVEILFKLEKYKEGVDILKDAIKREIQFPSLHHFMSQGYFALQDYPKAIKHIRSALHSDPENVTYLNQLGICFKESQDYQEAMKTYNSIIKLDPHNKAALFNKAILQHSMGQAEDAIKTLDRCITKHPTFLPAKTKLNEYKAALNKAG
jgi:tetratricopeptide (TPR) repeat protein